MLRRHRTREILETGLGCRCAILLSRAAALQSSSTVACDLQAHVHGTSRLAVWVGRLLLAFLAPVEILAVTEHPVLKSTPATYGGHPTRLAVSQLPAPPKQFFAASFADNRLSLVGLQGMDT